MTAPTITAPTINTIDQPEALDPTFKVWITPSKPRWLELRKTCITSTEMSGVAGLTKYGLTKFKIYQLKRNQVEDDFIDTNRTRVGRKIERVIADEASEHLGARVMKFNEFHIRGAMGASYDYEVSDEGHHYDGWLVECKNVDKFIWMDQWDNGGVQTIPRHIEIQVQSQLKVSGRPGCILSVLVGGNDPEFFYIKNDLEFGDALMAMAEDFWQEIQDGIVPVNLAEDVDVITSMYRLSHPETVYDATDLSKPWAAEIAENVEEFAKLKAEIKVAEEKLDWIKGDVLLHIEHKALLFTPGYKVITGHTKDNPGTAITQEMADETVGTITGARSGYRQFLVKEVKGGE